MLPGVLFFTLKLRRIATCFLPASRGFRCRVSLLTERDLWAGLLAINISLPWSESEFDCKYPDRGCHYQYKGNRRGRSDYLPNSCNVSQLAKLRVASDECQTQSVGCGCDNPVGHVRHDLAGNLDQSVGDSKVKRRDGERCRWIGNCCQDRLVNARFSTR